TTVESELFDYVVSENAAELDDRRKSKYYSTEFSRCLTSIRGNGRRYALVGVPCYIKAARALARQDAVLADQLRIFVGLVCGHMKSARFAELMAWQLDVAPRDLARVDFRRKTAAGRASQYDFAAQALGADAWATRRSMDLYGGDWGQALFQLKACDYCDDIFAETADVCFGDAWLPAYERDWKGTNIVVMRHAGIEHLLAQGMARGELSLARLAPEDAVRSQAGNFRHRRDGLSLRLMEAQRHGIVVPRKRVEPGSVKLPWLRARIVRIRSAMAKQSHASFQRAREQGDLSLFLMDMRPLRRKMRLTYRLMRWCDPLHVHAQLRRRAGLFLFAPAMDRPCRAWQLLKRHALAPPREALRLLRKARAMLAPSVSACASAQAELRWPAPARSILVIEHNVPEPDRDAGSRNVVEFLTTLARAGWAVHFWPRDGRDDPVYTSPLRAIGIDIIAGRLRPSLSRWLRQHGRSLDAILICRPDVADTCLGTVRRASDLPLLYYGHDLHCARMTMQAELSGSAREMAAARRMEAVERSIWRRADLMLYPSDEEARAVAQMAPGTVALPVTAFCYDRFIERQTAPGSLDILFVGGFRHAPNIDAALWCARQIFPLVKAACPAARFIIAGYDPPPEIIALAGSGIEVTGWLSAAELQALYDACRTVVVPLRFGAGMKLKVVEALAAGVPLVTTRVGAQGLDRLAGLVAVHDEASALAEALLAALQLSDRDWLQQSCAQIAYAKAHFSRENVLASLQLAFQAAHENHTRRWVRK
ncbi:MAG: hypothetical protein JWL62_1320, partial [Hyphomicrobiales bacterium]|nr:hypothetical protein [Hyphomicrobiales bacterium]